jgi:probable F420-dependent oxidoreductase
MKLGLFGFHWGASVEPDTLARRAQLAEQAGLESLWVGDHIALPSEVESADQPRLEALTAVSYLAALTSRVRLGLGVIVLPQRQPVLLAKQLSSIDALSGGRLILGIGVGWIERELAALGVSLAERGARTDEYLAVMRALWTEPAPSFDGRFVSFASVTQRPRPPQQPHPPITIGGHSPAAYRRAVQTGDGWYGVYLDVEETAEALTGLRTVAARHERPAGLGELEITITPPPGPVDLETARRYADLGVHRLAIRPASADDTAVEDFIGSVGETLIGQV